MRTKMSNSVIGYGYTDDDASIDSMINSCLISPIQINTSAYFKNTIERLRPWLPSDSSLQISGVGYFKVNGRTIQFNGSNEVKHTYNVSTPFKTIYDVFFDKLSFLELLVCLPYIECLLNKVYTNVKVLGGTYNILVPQSIDTLSGTLVITNDSMGIIYDNDIVGIKDRDGYEFWTHQVINNDIVDTLYYIAYRIGYSNMNNLLEM